VFLGKGIRETAAGSAQQEKELAGPEQNVQQPSTLQIIDVFAMQGYVQSSPRALFYERAQSRKLEGQAPNFLGSRIDSLQVFVAEIDEVVQAKILLSQ